MEQRTHTGLRLAFCAISIVLGFLLLETILRSFWPQENIFLLGYRDRYVFNNPGFSDYYAVSPHTSLEQFRRNWLSRWIVKSRIFESGYKVRIETNPQGLRAYKNYSLQKSNDN